MEKCPRCSHYTVAYDGYRDVMRCMIDSCSCIVHSVTAYSFAERNPSTASVDWVTVDTTEGKPVESKQKIL